MFHFVQAQTQYLSEPFLWERDYSFYFQVQKALLFSLWQEKYLTQTEYEQCLALLKDEADLYG